MASEIEFNIPINYKWSVVPALIFGILSIRSLTLNPPNYFVALVELVVGLVWARDLWHINIKEYRVKVSDAGIFFSRYLIERKEIMIEWRELCKIHKQTIIPHRSGLGAHSRLCFTFLNGKKMYLTKSFGPEFENAVSVLAKKHNVSLINLL